MKITFLNPPAIEGRAPDRNFGCNYGVTFQQSAHILYSAAVLEREGFDVEFIDCPVENKNKEWCEEFIENGKTDVFVFFTVYLAEKIDKYWTERIVKLRTNAKIIFMGPEPSYKMHKFLLNKNCFVIRGEPEKTILELIKELEKKNPNYNKILGLSWKNNNKIINNPPRPLMTNEELDQLPFPARHLIKNPLNYYNPKLKGRPTTTMITSRNCPYKCIFCIPCAFSFTRQIDFKIYFGRKPPIGLRSPENIIKEFKLIKKMGYRSVAIMDDNFIWKKERTLEICNAIKHLGLEIGCLARADRLQDEEILKAMKEAGFVYCDIGVESFNQKILDYMKKDVKAGDIFNAILLLKKNGIEPKINVLLGACPFETEEDIKWTVEVLKMLDIDVVSFGIVIPHPQTEFYEIVKKNNWFATESKDFEPVDPYREATVNLPNMDHEKLQKLVRWCYRSYYLRPEYIFRRFISIRSLRELTENIKTALNLFIRK